MGITTEVRPCSLWRYGIVSEKLYMQELGEYHTYGVKITAHEHAEVYHDISSCRKTVENIVQLLNYHNVSPVHFYDIVSDMLP